VNKSKLRANVSVSGLIVLGGLFAVACGGPNWQNQYTEEPDYSAGGSAGGGGGGGDSSDGGADDGSDACDPGTPNCNSTDLLAPPSRPGGPTPTDPQGNPDPVPWHIHPIILPHSQ
jgi:hypothetical protein